jgi:hypothetical protein
VPELLVTRGAKQVPRLEYVFLLEARWSQMDVRMDEGWTRRNEVPAADRPPEGAPNPDAVSVDERLAAIVDVIRSWDWRSSNVVEDLPPKRPQSEGRHAARHQVGPLAPCPEVPRRRPTPPKHVAADQRSFGAEPAPDPARPRADRTDRVPAGQPEPRRRSTTRLLAVPSPTETLAQVTHDPAPESEIPPFFAPPRVGAPRPPAPAPSDVTATPVDDHSAAPRPPQRWGRIALWAVAAALVVVVVAVIRMNAPGATSGSLTPTTVTKSSAPAALIAVSPSVKSAFAAASTNLNAANVTVTQALASSSGQSVAQITQEVTPYAAELNTFVLKLHALTWPETMQVPSNDLTLRTQALTTFIATISSVNATTLGAWVSQFHALATSTEAADNLGRRDIGLRSTSSYP